MKVKRKMLGVLGVLIVLLLSVLLLKGKGAEVETVLVTKGEITQRVKEIGYVQPADSCELYAEQNATVVDVLVEVGQAVKKGQAMMTLQNPDLALQISGVRSQLSQVRAAVQANEVAIQRAELELKQAEEDRRRLAELFESGAATREEYDQAGLLAETYRRNLAELHANLQRTSAQEAGLEESLTQLTAREQALTIKSPMDGIVLNLPVKAGQIVNPGSLLVYVAAPESLEVKAEILSDDVAEIRVGQEAVITAPVLGETSLSGKVKTIYPMAEERQSALGIAQRRVPVIIALEEAGNLKPGYEVKVEILISKHRDVLIIPKEAVRTTIEGQKQVMAVVDGRVRYRTVRTGISDSEGVEIIHGLEAADQIIKDGSLVLQEGAKVKAIP